MYYKVPLQYYCVLQSSTPVLLCATKYYSSTALYCSSTTLYYSTTPVLQGITTLFYRNTTPVLLYYKVPFQYYSVLQSAFPYYKVLLQHYSVLQSITLYYKVLLRTEESYMKWHWHYEEQQVSPSNLTKYCACHAKCFECLILVTYETVFTVRRATGVTLQPHQKQRLPHKDSHA